MFFDTKLERYGYLKYYMPIWIFNKKYINIKIPTNIIFCVVS